MENKYDIQASAKSNINSYNRYPFASFDEAVIQLRNKSLQPGEIAVAYYFDETSLNGINAVLAIGNLKRAENIIFKNPDIFSEEIDSTHKDVLRMDDSINNMLETVNHANKNYSSFNSRITVLENNTKTSEYVKCIDLDIYEDDLN